MQEVYDEFEKRDTVIVAVSQEDEDAKSAAKMAGKLRPKPRFRLAADVGRKQTARYKPTTAYLLDKEGIVRQIFPMTIHFRAPAKAILAEIDRRESE